MANLPSMGDREVLNSLRAQERLLENIANAITKRDSTLSRKEVKRDKRVVDEQQEQSMIKKLLSAFSGFGKTRLSAQELQLKTLEETKVTKSIVQRTGLDIEFIRKSFEEGQKKKDRELLSEAIKTAISGNSGGGMALGATIGATLISGFKTITGVIGKAISSVLLPVLNLIVSVLKNLGIKMGLIKAVDKISDVVGGIDADKQRKGKDAGKEKGGLLGGLFGRLLKFGVGAGAALFPSSLGDGTRENYKPDISAEQLERLKQEEFFLKQLEKDEELRKKYESIGNIPEQNKFFREYMNNFLTTATESQVEEYNKVKEDSEKLIQEKADKALREIKPIDSMEFDSLVDESGETLDKLGKSFKKLAEKLSKNDFIKEITNALTSIGTLKFADGEVNLFKGAGDVLSSAYNEAKSLFADATEKPADQSGQMNTQVNNTNVIGGSSGSSPVYFPNATAIDGHSSLSRFLQSSGAIR